MKLLAIISLILFLCSLYVIIFQMIIPAYKGERLFPMFRDDPLSNEVQQTKYEVDSMEDHVVNLNDLVDLTKRKSKLERELEEAAAELKADGQVTGSDLPSEQTKDKQ